ncbi:MAG: hypothetical protein AAF355_12815 [Myxococcota bacterium]
MPSWLGNFAALVWQNKDKYGEPLDSATDSDTESDFGPFPHSRYVRDLHLRDNEWRLTRVPEGMNGESSSRFISKLYEQPRFGEAITNGELHIGITQGIRPFSEPYEYGEGGSPRLGSGSLSPANRQRANRLTRFQDSPTSPLVKRPLGTSPKLPSGSMRNPVRSPKSYVSKEALIATLNEQSVKSRQDSYIKLTRSQLLHTTEHVRARVYLTRHPRPAKSYQIAAELGATLMLDSDAVANAILIASPWPMHWRPDAIVICLKDAKEETIRFAANTIARIERACQSSPDLSQMETSHYAHSSTALGDRHAFMRDSFEPIRGAPRFCVTLDAPCFRSPLDASRQCISQKLTFAAANWTHGESYGSRLQALFGQVLDSNRTSHVMFFGAIWHHFNQSFPQMLALSRQFEVS